MKSARPLTLVITQRNTTALFGDGLIDQIPDATLHALAAAQSKHPEVSGRVAPVESFKVGRFGWRGQIEHLHDFNLGAARTSWAWRFPPRPSRPTRCPRIQGWRPRPDELAMPVVNYVCGVAACAESSSRTIRTSSRRYEHGYKVFHAVGCAVCHVGDRCFGPGNLQRSTAARFGAGASGPGPRSSPPLDLHTGPSD